MARHRLFQYISCLLIGIFFALLAGIIQPVDGAPQPNTNQTLNQPAIEIDKEANLLGEKVSVNVSDPESNKDKAAIDHATVHVNTTSDKKGINIPLLETGKNTGIFVGNFTTRFGASSNLTSFVLASPGDNGLVTCCHGDVARPFFDLSDIDQDGILDNWERFGIDSNEDGVVDFTLPCTPDTINPSIQVCPTPLRKDVYVEVDYMQNHKPNQTAIDWVVSNFSSSPVRCTFILCYPVSLSIGAPTGISLHVQIDNSQNIPEQTSLAIWGGFDNIKSTNFGTAPERSDPNSANILKAKSLVYHYALFTHDQGAGGRPGSSGKAELPPVGAPYGSNDFIVSLGGAGWGVDPRTGHTVGTTDQQAAAFMHELGHNLNLHHGGNDENNCKPNYLSVMSYSRQNPIPILTRKVDYSWSNLPVLNENSLSDQNGIGLSTPPGLSTIYSRPSAFMQTSTGVPVDWNGNNNLQEVIPQNINDFRSVYDSSCDGSLDSLNGYNDWLNLRYSFVNSPDAADGAHQKVVNTTELTIDMVFRSRIAAINSLDYLIQNLSADAFTNPKLMSTQKNSLHNIMTSGNDSITKLLNSSKIDAAVAKLLEIRTKMDTSFGGNPGNDIIADFQVQRTIVPLIDNVIVNLRNQK